MASNEAPIARIADERQRDILTDRPLRQEGLKPICRNQHKTCRDRVTRMVELQLPAVGHDISAVVADHARNEIEQLLLSLTLKRGYPENLSWLHGKRHILENMAVAQIMHRERRIFGRIAIQLPALSLGGMRL